MTLTCQCPTADWRNYARVQLERRKLVYVDCGSLVLVVQAPGHGLKRFLKRHGAFLKQLGFQEPSHAN